MEGVLKRRMRVIGPGKADHPGISLLNPLMTAPNGLARDIKTAGTFLSLDISEFLLPVSSFCDCFI